MSGDAIECLKCNERFFDARPWEEVEKQLCFYCEFAITPPAINIDDENTANM